MPPLPPLLLFIYLSGHHRDLHSFPTRRSSDLHGTAMGHEFVGEVVETGKDVSAFKSGDRVMSPFSTSCGQDRKSTRLNSNHVEISYAVFCLKKKKTPIQRTNVVSLTVTIDSQI